MPLYEVDKTAKTVGEIKPTTFPALKLWERQDLEAWVTSSPELAGGDFVVVTSEFDRFDKTSERLDVLGLTQTESGGRLVVVELKRDGMSTTVDLQAIKYAAYVAAAQFSDVVEMYASYHKRSEADSRATLLAYLGGDDEDPPVIDDTPRIVLVASDFRAEVTTTVLWLIDNYEVDIRCVRLQPFAVGERVLVHSEVIIPLPEAEQYRLGVQRKRREAEEGLKERVRAGRLLPRLVEAGALEMNQTLYFRKDEVPGDAAPWSKDNLLYRATLVSAEGNRTLRWTDPTTQETHTESPSLLAARVLGQLAHQEDPVSSAGINGMYYWTVDGRKSLRSLGAEAGVLDGAPRSIDRPLLRKLCANLPPGKWTTYGDIAAAIGLPGAAQSVAGAIATDKDLKNAHRILRANGQISPGWAAVDGGPAVARARLLQDGITFGPGDAADPGSRLSAADLTRLAME